MWKLVLFGELQVVLGANWTEDNDELQLGGIK